jgi:hypothetical protein
LATVPEDFGFNIASVAEVHRRRAELLDALGQRTRLADRSLALHDDFYWYWM